MEINLKYYNAPHRGSFNALFFLKIYIYPPSCKIIVKKLLFMQIEAKYSDFGRRLPQNLNFLA
ncbi:hypothetical protein SAMN05421544_11831 [Riemerella columbipharyngis]|uniref:Uncharacterized protein n=1 Tax=Riemerella columbipharyngis TaxID=1071918 RepID=A0A1G7EYY2_9FLAO|nr:hypothetical protein SAMN05421544_11831 [Riemerella columbipharyngis]